MYTVCNVCNICNKSKEVENLVFNSFSFAIFLPIVFALYWLLPHKYRWPCLLAASYYFYMSWNATYVLILFCTTLVSYIAARWMENEKSAKKKKAILVVSLIAFVGTLLFFKYFNFISESVAAALSLIAVPLDPLTLKLVLPVGISFYIFQTISYVVDVYKGTAPAEHHFGYYATFISFFPQLLSGPIPRANGLLPQIKRARTFNYDQATYGLKLFAMGFLKKVAVADVISGCLGKVFQSPQEYTGFIFVLAVLFYTVQIYCDFSGYSDMAIGVAKLFGIDLMINFKSPYFSQSIKEFWSRWHISLSTWLRDYIYIPLGGNRVGKFRHALNVLITFLISGLWHGANWTFVIWGGLHGLAQVAENRIVKKRESKGVVRWIRIFAVFIFVSFAWIFFASNSLSDAVYIIKNLFVGIGSPGTYLSNGFASSGFAPLILIRLMLSLLILTVFDYCSLKRDVIEWISSRRKAVRWIVYALFVIFIFMNLQANNSSEFIYFQF